MPLDKRLIGEQNARLILTALHRFGWLTTRMIAALVWSDASQSIAMARRTLNRLIDDRRVLKRPLPDGGDCYVLSAAGARWLHEEQGLAAKPGSTLKLGNALHRACSNWYLIHRHLAGDDIWTEYEIQTGRAPVFSVGGKTPDGLVMTPLGLIWVEVENAWKNLNERARVVNFCQHCLLAGEQMAELAPDFYLFRVAVVSTNPEARGAMLRSFADAAAAGDLSSGQIEHIEIALLPVDKSLQSGAYEECLLADVFA